MKRFYTNLKAMATKMLAVALVGVAAVSCAQAYDDTDLQNQIADLTERVTTLEERLDSEVAALRALIDEKVALAEAAADGAWKFTLSDGKTLTVYPQYVDNGITVVTVGGVQYWAKANGAAEPVLLKDANGNPVEVVNAPEVRVNAEGNVEVSVDGGATWVACEGTPGLFAAIDVKDNHACLTLQSGEVLKFALYEQVNFSIDGNVLFVGSEETEKVTMTLDGIVEIFPLVVPEGWSVDINGLVMSVTAPYAEPEMGGGGMPGWPGMPGMGGEEEVGTPAIKVLAVSKEGKAVVATLYVVASGNGGQSIKVMGEQLVITNNKQVEGMDYETWETIMVPAPMAYTAFPTGEYTLESFAAAKQNFNYKYEILYVEENGTMKMDVAETLKAICGVEKIERGDSYTFIAFDADLYSPTVTDIMTATYTSTYVDVASSAQSFKDIQLDITVEGYNGYKVIIYDTEYYPDTNETVKEELGYWKEGWGALGIDLTANYSGSLFDIDNSGMIMPYANRVYALYVLPISSLKSNADYTFEDILGPFTFKTKNYTSGGMLQPTFGEYEPTSYTNVSVDVIPAVGAYRTHAHYFTAEQLASFASEADLIAEIIANGVVSAGDEPANIYTDALKLGSSVTVAAICIDENGKYGPVTKKEFATKTLEFSPVKLEITEWTLNVSRNMTYTANSYAFGLNVTGGEFANIFMKLTTANDYTKLDSVTGSFAMDILDENYYNVVNVADLPKNDAGLYAPAGRIKAYKSTWQQVTIGLNYGQKYILTLVGVDADGKVSEVAYKEIETYVPMTMVYADDAKWAASKPTITIGETTVLGTMYDAMKENWEQVYNMYINNLGYTEEEAKAEMEMMVQYGELVDPEKMSDKEKAYPSSVDIAFTVKPGEGAVKCLVEYNSDGNFDEIAPRVWVDKMVGDADVAPEDGKVSQHMVYEITAETTLTAQSVATNVDNYVYVTWMDAEGNWYEAVETILYKQTLYEE